MSPVVARGFNLLATPRWFAAGRVVRASSRVLVGASPGPLSATHTEATIGYRWTPDFTLRVGYQGSTAFKRARWEHALAVSAVWSQRWW